MTSSWKEKTCGGTVAHCLRRLVHVSMFLIPWVYWLFGIQVASWFSLNPKQFILAVVCLITWFEGLRLWRGWVVFGQRVHERRQLSSLFWGVLSIALVLIYAPNPAYYIPIITVCAWVDPLVGELRTRQWQSIWVFLAGLILAWLIWGISAYFLGSSLWMGLFFGLLAVYFERFNWRYVDDNALMQLIPLLFYVLFFRVN